MKALAFTATPVWADSKISIKQYDDGSVYKGTFKDGIRHGLATYVTPNGFTYTGQWIDGGIGGQGIAKYPNGSLYEGQFLDGKPHGQGSITFAAVSYTHLTLPTIYSV